MKRYPTKIMPPDYERVFERRHLLDSIKRSKTAKVIWVHGPPGAGKTIFVASFLKTKGESFLWYRIDNSGNHFADIFYFLGLAAQKNNPHKKIRLPIFTSEYANDILGFARVFFRQLFASLTRESVIVLDNCHELEKDTLFIDLLQIVVNELPQEMRFFCIGRSRPHAALSHWYLSNEMLEIGNSELIFSAQESHAFLKWLDPQLDEYQIQQIQSKTQGWAAGMVMMARQYAFLGFSEAINTESNVFDYLVSEILLRLPKELREFLVISALFNQLTAEMGLALTECRQAKLYLDELVSRNFLIERIASTKPIYRFHPLLKDLLLMQADLMFERAYWQQLQRKAATILIKEGSAIEAMMILQELKDWPALKGLLLQHASKLVASGRHHIVMQWVEVLPQAYLSEDAWLRYWYAAALKPASPLLAEQQLEHCYRQFSAECDVMGVYSAWQAAVESIAVSWDDTSRFEIWVARLSELRQRFPVCPSIDLKIQFYATAIYGLSIYNPQHPWLRSMIRICERVFHSSPSKTTKMLLSTQLAHHYLLTCRLSKLRAITPFLESALEDKSLPMMPRIMCAYLLSIQKLYLAESIAALEFVRKGLELSRASGIYLFEDILLANGIGCHIGYGNLVEARNILQYVLKNGNTHQRLSVSMIHSYAAWLAALDGNLHYALEQNGRSLRLTRLINLEIGHVCSLSLKVQILAELSQFKKAENTLLLLNSIIGNSCWNQFNLIQYYVAEAWLAHLRQNEREAVAAIHRLFKILSAEQIYTFFNWRPKMLVTFCLIAVENGIEEMFAIKLLKRHQLMPSPPPFYLESWPWTVRIHSFGALTIAIEGKLLKQTGKTQKKILELLETLILLGGRNVNCDDLTELLWPEADGDMARQSLETALHRLRKLIGKDAIMLNSGMISLNDSYCWLDLWAFEATVIDLEKALSGGNSALIQKLTDRLLSYYTDTFMKNSDSGLAFMKQAQLLNKLTHALERSINFHEKSKEHERVCWLLNKGMELVPLVESNYRRLMSYYVMLGQPDQALQVYRQCYRVLYKGFNLPLSREIQLLASQLEVIDR